MSKKYVGKTCVYCVDAPATSADHVFAREFFLHSDRSELPQVPACDRCNRDKSVLEHYLTAVLPFGGKHTKASQTLEEMVPKRLAKNGKLRRELNRGMTRVWGVDRGLYLPTGAIPVDGSKLEKLVALIARGLLWFHWKTLLRQDDVVHVEALTSLGEEFFTHIFSMRSANRVHVDIADGVIQYDGVQSADPMELSVWRIWFYGGVLLGDHKAKEFSTVLGAITGPPAISRLMKPLSE
jgi:hypothetical protein